LGRQKENLETLGVGHIGEPEHCQAKLLSFADMKPVPNMFYEWF